MAATQVQTPVPDVGKLRPVLDYVPCETCLDMYTPEQDYYCAICVRLTRDVVVRRTALGSDEAVQVIPPEDFSMAKDLRDRIQQQELELQEARARLTRLQNRENELNQQLRKLQEDLDRARREKDEASLIPFEFVGVKEAAKAEEFLEFAEEEEGPPAEAPIAWEPAEPVPTPPEGVVPGPEAEAPEFQPATAEEAERGVPAAPSGGPDDAIARIESEIAKIEKELAQVAEQEQALAKKGEGRRKKKR